jgi:hypothetical protein
VLTPTQATTGRASAASQRPVPAPRRTSHRQGSRLTRHQRGFKQFARPVFPSSVAARMERAALGLEPRASHPADQEPDSARRGGDRSSSTDLELHAQLTSVDLQSGSSLNACDLGSHVAKAIVRICGALMTKALAGGLLAFRAKEDARQSSEVCVAPGKQVVASAIQGALLRPLQRCAPDGRAVPLDFGPTAPRIRAGDTSRLTEAGLSLSRAERPVGCGLAGWSGPAFEWRRRGAR